MSAKDPEYPPTSAKNLKYPPTSVKGLKYPLNHKNWSQALYYPKLSRNLNISGIPEKLVSHYKKILKEPEPKSNTNSIPDTEFKTKKKPTQKTADN